MAAASIHSAGTVGPDLDCDDQARDFNRDIFLSFVSKLFSMSGCSGLDEIHTRAPAGISIAVPEAINDDIAIGQ